METSIFNGSISEQIEVNKASEEVRAMFVGKSLHAIGKEFKISNEDVDVKERIIKSGKRKDKIGHTLQLTIGSCNYMIPFSSGLDKDENYEQMSNLKFVLGLKVRDNPAYVTDEDLNPILDENGEATFVAGSHWLTLGLSGDSDFGESVGKPFVKAVDPRKVAGVTE